MHIWKYLRYDSSRIPLCGVRKTQNALNVMFSSQSCLHFCISVQKLTPMDIYTDGHPLIPTDVHWYPLTSIKTHRHQSIPTSTCGHPQISMNIHQYPWTSIDIHWHLWTPVDIYWSRLNLTELDWAPPSSTEFHGAQPNSTELNRESVEMFMNPELLLSESPNSHHIWFTITGRWLRHCRASMQLIEVSHHSCCLEIEN